MPPLYKFKLKRQYVELKGKPFRGRILHYIQQTMFNLKQFKEEVIILTAPTGTGKSYSFPLPIVADKLENNHDGYSPKKCLIIAPTNALIKDMCKEYMGDKNQKALFPNLKFFQLNSIELNKLEVHGDNRWNAVLDIIENNDIVITNPDLLNWAVAGGYSFHKYQEQITRIFQLVDYFVLDEYHLYDEEQVAFILAWMLFVREVLKQDKEGKKFIFASATPELALQSILKDYRFKVKEIKEEIISEIPTGENPNHYRRIKGDIELIFQESADEDMGVIKHLMENDVVIQHIQKGASVLAIFDRLVSLRIVRPQVEAKYHHFNIAEESGYLTKSKKIEDTANANLILATNKVEIGVNLGVSYCVMPPGKYLSNFIQRFGRVARGKLEKGTVVLIFNRLPAFVKKLPPNTVLTYPELIQLLRASKQLGDRLFYKKVVPRYLGAYFFIIRNRTLKNYSHRTIFEENISIKAYEIDVFKIYTIMNSINNTIKYDLSKFEKRYASDVRHITNWWKEFCKTFQYFRGESQSVDVIDYDLDGLMTNYSKEWILKHRFVINEKIIGEKKYLEVSGYREEKAEIQFIVDTFPFGELNVGDKCLSQQERWTPKTAFKKRLYYRKKEWKRRSSSDNFSKIVLDLINRIGALEMIFTQKRMKITDIREDSIIL